MTALARLSLANRALVGLATLITVVAGLFATTSLRQELIPELELPIVAVVAPFPGASPEIVEAQVTAPIEAAASRLPGLETVESTASGGLSATTIELAYGTDIPAAQQELTQAVAGLSGRLPEGVDPQVITGSIEDFPVVQLAASGGADESELVAALQREVVPALQGVEGVRDVSLSGIRAEVVTVVPDQAALAAAGLGPDAIAGALGASGTVVPAGQVTTGGQSLSVQVGRPLDLDALRRLPLPGTERVSLGDVATVELALEEPTSFSRADGEPSIGIAVTKTPDGNTVEVSQAIEELVPVTVGASGDGIAALLGGGGSNQATFAVTADDDADVAALTDRLRDRIADLGDVGEVVVSAGQGGAFTSRVEVVVQSSSGSDEELAQAAEAVTDAVREVPGATDVTSNLASGLPTLQVQVDRGAAAAVRLTEAQIGRTVAGVLRGVPVGSITAGQGRTDVVLDSGAAPATVEELRALVLPGTAGPVPLGDVAEVVETSVPASVSRQDGERSATITATPADEDLGALTADLQAALDDLALPEGTTAEIGGVSADQEEAFADLGLALIAAIAIVYLIMVATFRSLLQPLILLVSVPFAATGAIGMLLVTGTPLGVPSLIGMLMLVGIVVTNAIVLIDLVNQYRRQGLGVTESVLEGGRHRLRPIVMTALATVFALVPMALGFTGGSVFISQPLALVVIGGLISSTVLTLVLVPVLYVLLERASARVRRRPPPEPVPAAQFEEPSGARA